MKLLSVIQTRSVCKVGSNKSVNLNLRIICATNAPIYELVATGKFRHDLFYRIKTVEIKLPGLRDRKEDIPLFVNHFLEEFCRRYGKTVELDPLVMQKLLKYPWPGNIRELQHSIERAVILCRDHVLTENDFHLSNHVEYDETDSTTFNLSDVERNTIKQVLKKWNGNLTRAAEELGIGRTTLYRKIEAYGLN